MLVLHKVEEMTLFQVHGEETVEYGFFDQVSHLSFGELSDQFVIDFLHVIDTKSLCFLHALRDGQARDEGSQVLKGTSSLNFV